MRQQQKSRCQHNKFTQSWQDLQKPSPHTRRNKDPRCTRRNKKARREGKEEAANLLLASWPDVPPPSSRSSHALLPSSSSRHRSHRFQPPPSFAPTIAAYARTDFGHRRSRDRSWVRSRCRSR
jgi:hypothetical protein